MKLIRKILKAKFFLLTSTVILLSFFPLPASAVWWKDLINAFLYIPFALVYVFLGVIVLVTALLARVTGALLDWIISPSFVSLSYTRPCPGPLYIQTNNCNPIVGIGLDITQDFVNLILVVFLVVIALSIALNLQEYASKKVLVKLIAIALLVNFAPLLVGLIVDASNIVMNFFLQGITESNNASNFIAQAVKFGENIWDALLKVRADITERAGLLAMGIAQIFLNIMIMGAFFIFAGIFIVRYVVIWVLTILSPLALLAWILPVTARYFKMWLTQLVHWSVIGIPTAFFLYLAMNSFGVLQTTFTSNLQMPGIEDKVVGWFDQAFPFFVILIFLYLGFALGLTTGAMGAEAIIKATRHVRAWTGRQGLEAARRIRPVEQAEAWTRRHIERIPLVGRAFGGPGAYERERQRKLESARTEMKSIPDTVEGNEALRRWVNRVAITQRDRERRAAAMEILAQRKELSGITNMPGAIAEAQRMGANVSQIYKARPDLAQYLIDPTTGRPMGAAGIEWAMQRITPADVHQKLQKEALADNTVVLAIAREEQKLRQLGRQGTDVLKGEFEKTFNSLINKYLNDEKVKIGDRLDKLNDEQVKILDRALDQMAKSPWWQH